MAAEIGFIEDHGGGGLQDDSSTVHLLHILFFPVELIILVWVCNFIYLYHYTQYY